MNNNPYSHDECLAIVNICSSLELHLSIVPDEKISRILGKGLLQKILEMNHRERIDFIKEVSDYI